ncbi:MAG: type I-C CRISPR-associated protein Cas8c/Csd1, partial [Pseudomonadota bacterium]
MLVQALAAYADTYLADRLADPAFEEKPVPYGLQIWEDGTFAGIRTWMREITLGKKTRPAPIERQVPKSPINRNSQIFPLLGCDAVQYLLGPGDAWTKPAERAKHQHHHEAFVNATRGAAEETKDPLLRACAIFYERPEEVEKARNQLAAFKPKPGSLVALVAVSRDPASEHPDVLLMEHPRIREYWRKHFASDSMARMQEGGEGMCLISGQVGPIAPTHNKIKGLSKLGGQASGVSLMSFDKPAFRSYGWEQNANSPVSPERATAYVLALNDLLHLGKHRRGTDKDTSITTRFDAAGVGFLFWTREPSDDDFSSLFTGANPEEVRKLLSAPQRGRDTTLDPSQNDFYLL